MSYIQNIIGKSNGKLALQWELYCEPRALSIQIASDSEFKKNMRHFIFPVCTACELDCGMGIWFFRIGAWLGSELNGKIEWSGVNDTVQVISKNPMIKEQAEKTKLLHTQAIDGGVRLHTGQMAILYTVLEYDDGVRGSRAIYVCDNIKGYFDCLGLSCEYKYSIRMMTFSKIPSDSVLQLSAGITVHNKAPIKPIKRHNMEDYTVGKAFKAILAEPKPTKFADYRQYINYVNARERSRDKLEN